LKIQSTILLILFLFTFFCRIEAENEKLDSINYYIAHQSYYDELKENRIKGIKKSIALNKNANLILYPLYTDLFNEYRSYIYDSAYVYVEKLIDVSKRLDDKDKITSSKVKQGFCFLSSGLFNEAFDILSSFNVRDCSTDTKIDYYTCKSRLYYDMADYNKMPEFRKRYNDRGNVIIDSAIMLLPQNNSRYWSAVGLKNMKTEKYSEAIDAFQKMINSQNYSEHDFAIATSSIAYILGLQGNKDEAKKYLIQAAIADIKSSTKETVALRNLAQLLYKERDITTAVVYIRQALKDASFYNARHRQLEIGNILPIIEGERVNIIEKQRDRVELFVVFIMILVIALVFALYFIRKSLKHLQIAKQEIQATNQDLMDANLIKNEYIGYFFNQNSEFIEKLGFLQRWVNKKVIAKQYDELKKFPQNMDIQKEREALFERFDKIFLKIFPNFVEEFNKLLKPEEQIHLKNDELLNTDLRIYALIRLGINDVEKIAHFLDYSVNTIYTYKTKIKSKALYEFKDFKRKLMEIKSY